MTPAVSSSWQPARRMNRHAVAVVQPTTVRGTGQGDSGQCPGCVRPGGPVALLLMRHGTPLLDGERAELITVGHPVTGSATHLRYPSRSPEPPSRPVRRYQRG